MLEKDPSYQYASTTLSASSIRTQFSLALNVRMSLFGAEFLAARADRVGLVRRAYLVLATAENELALHANRDMQCAEELRLPCSIASSLPHAFPDSTRRI